jgi:hypothetical protein
MKDTFLRVVDNHFDAAVRQHERYILTDSKLWIVSYAMPNCAISHVFDSSISWSKDNAK